MRCVEVVSPDVSLGRLRVSLGSRIDLDADWSGVAISTSMARLAPELTLAVAVIPPSACP